MEKHVLITGASRGIGYATAQYFAQNGYHLYLTCKENIKVLSALSHELSTTYKIKCHIFQGDISDFSFIKAMFSQIPTLDILINNAGISYFGLLQDMEIDQWHTILNTNISSCFYTSKLAIPHMLNSGQGKIINISSIWGTHGASMEVAYSTAKGAMNTFSKALGKELAPSNIQVNAIALGAIDTDMNRLTVSPDDIASLIDEIPTNRLGTPEEAAQLIFQLATAPNYLTGQIISMDGGMF